MKALSFKLVVGTLCLCTIVAGIVPVQASQFDDIHNKYWYYRWRLQQGFLKVGPDWGESLPAGRRSWDGSAYVKWGDATIYLGQYICVLATEYRLLSNNGQWSAASKTLSELYYAMRAIERLDYWGNTATPYLQPAQMDGHVIRDDVRGTFVANNWQHFNEPCISLPTADTANSDYIAEGLNASGEPRNKDKDMSQDQAIWLITGLSVVNNVFQPGNHTVHLLDGSSTSFDFDYICKEIAKRIIRRVRNWTGVIDDWRIHVPNGHLARRGFDAKTYSNAFAKAYKTFNNGGALPGAPFAQSAGSWLWQPQQNKAVIAALSADNRSMASALALMTDSFRQTVSVFRGPYRLIRIPLPINTTYKGLKNLGKPWNWETLYVPWWKFQHNKSHNIGSIVSKAFDQLVSAPCAGPYSLGSGHTHAWAADRKFGRASNVQNNGSGNHGYYNGIDYMMLHNMYYLNSNDPSRVLYQNKICRELTNFSFPGVINGNLVGQLPSLHYLYGAFSDITASNTVNSNGNVSYQAGKCIRLKPGFHAKKQSYFRAFINCFGCNGEAGALARKSGNTHGGLLYAMAPDYERQPTDETFTSTRNNTPRDHRNTEGFDETLLLYPNPVRNGEVTVRLPVSAAKGAVRLCLRDIHNRTVLTRTLSQNESRHATLDVSGLAGGVYFVELKTGVRIMVQKLLVH